MRLEHPRRPSIEPLESRRLLAAVALADLALTEGPAYTVPDPTSAVMGGAVYMAVTRDQNNTELWRSDGTAAGGATLVKSFNVFKSTSADTPPPIANLTAVGGTLFFTVGQAELWKSDGTAAGTARLAYVDTTRGSPTTPYTPEFVNAGGTLYFTARGSFGGLLWSSDGTSAGTRQLPVLSGASGISRLVPQGTTLYFTKGGVYKLTAGSSSAVSVSADTPVAGRSLAVLNGSLYFLARPWAGGAVQLYRYDGGAAAPQGWGAFTDYSRDPSMAVAGGKLYFGASAAAGQALQELWQSDGTTAGTRMVKDINPTWHSTPAQLTAFGDLVYFTADDDVHGVELWRSDGTEAGTLLLADLEPGTTSGAPSRLTPVGGRLFFSARTADAGYELWQTDGTPVGTTRATDLYAGPGSSSPHELITAGDTLYFQAVDSVTGYGLFALGAAGGSTTLLKDYIAGPMNGTIDRAAMADGRLAFAAGDLTSTGRELYVSDGTPAGTGLLKDIYTTAWNASVPTSLTRVGDAVYFSASSSFLVGAELWKTDGTAAGTVLVKDIRPNTSQFSSDRGSSPRSMIDAGGTLYFVADDGTNGRQFYRSDGTDAGTVVIPVPSGSRTPNMGGVFEWGGVPYVFTDLDVLQKYTGTSLTTVKGLTQPPNGASYSARFFTARPANGVLWLNLSDGVNGAELWKTDGTPAGTVLVKEINTNTDFNKGTIHSSPSWFTGLGPYVYFSATELAHGNELWRTDGTAAGTTLLADVNPGTGYSSPADLLRLGETLLFTADDGVHGRELWRTDGTPGGTVLVKDINAGTAACAAAEFTMIGDEVWFTAVDDATGVRHLWVTDGTAAGTVRASDAVPGFTAANPMNLTVAGSALYLTANDGVSGPRLYRIDANVLAPNVIRSAFVSRGPRPEVSLTFTKDLGPALDTSNFDLRNTATGGQVDPTSLRLEYDPAHRRATLTLRPTAVLPDGNYRLTLPAAAVQDGLGRPMAGDFTFDFFLLAGDANRDRIVNFADLLALARNYNGAGKTWADGDFDGNGIVNFSDLLTLARNYNKTLPASGTAPAPAAAMDVGALAAAMGIASPTTTPAKPTPPPAPAKKPLVSRKLAPKPTPAVRAVTPVPVAPKSPPASVLRDDDKAKPVFSTTRVVKPAPPTVKPKVVAKAKGR